MSDTEATSQTPDDSEEVEAPKVQTVDLSDQTTTSPDDVAGPVGEESEDHSETDDTSETADAGSSASDGPGQPGAGWSEDGYIDTER